MPNDRSRERESRRVNGYAANERLFESTSNNRDSNRIEAIYPVMSFDDTLSEAKADDSRGQSAIQSIKFSELVQ